MCIEPNQKYKNKSILNKIETMCEKAILNKTHAIR